MDKYRDVHMCKRVVVKVDKVGVIHRVWVAPPSVPVFISNLCTGAKVNNPGLSTQKGGNAQVLVDKVNMFHAWNETNAFFTDFCLSSLQNPLFPKFYAFLARNNIFSCRFAPTKKR